MFGQATKPEEEPMLDTRKDKLSRMAARGGTLNEREIAARLLKEMEPYQEERNDVWEEQGTLIRCRGGARAFLRQPALIHFLKHAKEGMSFTYKTIPYADDFGSGEFYVILSWLLKNGLASKEGSRYTISSVKDVRDCWNRHVKRMMI